MDYLEKFLVYEQEEIDVKQLGLKNLTKEKVLAKIKDLYILK